MISGIGCCVRDAFCFRRGAFCGQHEEESGIGVVGYCGSERREGGLEQGYFRDEGRC